MCLMLDDTLTAEELAQLRAEHRRTRDQREADRIKAVVSLASGWTAEQVAAVLLVDPTTVRTQFRRVRQGGLPRLLQTGYHGSDGALSDNALVALEWHLKTIGISPPRTLRPESKSSLPSLTPPAA